jgi:ATP-binding cassette, subfamily B, bacterial PglK
LRFIRKMFQILTQQQKRQLLLLQALSIFVSLIEIMGIASIAPFMAVASNPLIIHSNGLLSSLYSIGQFRSDNSFLKALGVLVIFTVIIGNGSTFFLNWRLTSFGVNLGRTISVSLFMSYLKKPYLFHTQNNTAILAKNVFQEVLRVTNNVIVQSLVLVSKLLTILFILSGLILLNPGLALMIGFALGACYMGIYLQTRQRLHSNGSQISLLLGQGMQLVNEGLGSIKDVKLNSKENFYKKLLNDNLERFGRLSTYNSIVPMAPRFGLEILTLGGAIASFVYFLDLGQTISEFLPQIALFAMAGLRLMPALQQAFSSLSTIRSNMFCFDLIEKDLTFLGEPQVPISNHISFQFKNFKTIEINSLSFKYQNSESLVLKDISLKIEKNTINAFVGPSGSGKTTLVDVICGLLSAESGSVSIDGTMLSELNIANWQSEISYVPQNVFLLDGSFKENIAFGVDKESIDVELLHQAAKQARIHDFILSRPLNYDANVGERGVQISGGQRQRIGIARALYRNPSVLIFDEATSALDSITESEIMESINSLAGKKTIIIVAHRMTTIKSCNHIYLVDKGVLLAKGTYQDLVKSNLLFQELVNEI